jgi:hypothetical protein
MAYGILSQTLINQQETNKSSAQTTSKVNGSQRNALSDSSAKYAEHVRVTIENNRNIMHFWGIQDVSIMADGNA